MAKPCLVSDGSVGGTGLVSGSILPYPKPCRAGLAWCVR
ncbi:hypothetical protein AO370_0764 [Moraxella catarrhalis]|uniref:Uncharacterized protein n=1 Tax=Moraxella catarrhalis TaxID=480 RepID=A0AB36DPU8_MORCA|nr:hypothetical protein AO370_0764 [Moraxella catarrhalis]